jgi:aldehyde:ferredoxin oxidoreductase
VGPVTREEYQSRAERYDKQLKELVGIDPTGKPVEEKMAVLREYRMDQYNKVVDVAYERRGWDKNGVPTPARLKELGIDLPQIMSILQKGQ